MFLTLCEKLQFPAPAVQALETAFAQLEKDPALPQASNMFLTEGADPKGLLETMAQNHGIARATVTAVALVQAVPGLLQRYREKAIDEGICWDTLMDLRCKLMENHAVTGIWGIDPIGWYCRLFTVKIIKLGRLEFEPIDYRWDTACGELSKDCPVLNIHIPSCGSLPMDEVIRALQQAYLFFGGSGNMPFVCTSWLLYPPMCEAVFCKDSNLYRFYRCFHIAEQYADPDNKDFWRIFRMPFTCEALDTAPADTSLRRNLLAWMKQGNPMGIGRGAFLFDGKNILH